MENRARSIASSKAALALAAMCGAAFGASLGAKQLIYDDHFIIGSNPLLKQGLRGALRLAVTGYWDAVTARAARVEEYRPLLMETFLAQNRLHASQAGLHAVNLLLHLAACVLLFAVLARHLRPRAALFAALIFAALPIHAEAVDLLTGRSEVMCAALMLAAWLRLEAGRPAKTASGLALYGAALLTKESAVLFPLILALGDWTLHGQRPWSRERRAVQARLWALSFAYMALRRAVLGTDFQGGRPYFPSRLAALATLPGFALKRYAWPTVSGLGICTDFSRPMIPDASWAKPATWLGVASAAGLLAALALGCRGKRPWAFALLGPALTLLPTCHLIMPLDTIGAQRFLYVPTMGAAALAGYGLDRLGKGLAWAGVCLLLAWYVRLSAAISSSWTTSVGYYGKAVACNPTSGRSLSALGASFLAAGDVENGRLRLEQALTASPGLPGPYYNLAVLAWKSGNAEPAAALALEALKREPADPDSWTLLGAALEARGRKERARHCYEKALALWPDDEEARENLDRLAGGRR